MKKNFLEKFISLTLIAALALVTCTTSYANNSPIPEQNGYVYAITPESEQWAEKSVSELYELTNIPIEVYKNMDTSVLTQAVIDYPFLGDIYAFNSVEIGISAVSERFSALKELLERPGVETVLQEEYSQIGNTLANTRNIKDLDLDVAMKFRIIGSLLSKGELYQNIEMNDLKKLSSISRTVEDVTGLSSTIESRATTTVKTPNGSSVTVNVVTQDLSTTDKNAADKYMDASYPNATRIRSASLKYNCHSYAWYSTSASNNYWMDDPSKYMSDGSYTHVGNKPTAVGQKMYYPFGANDHSAIVKKLSTTGMFRDIIVTSKWGEYGLYEHSAQECPYFENGAINYPFYK